MTSRRSGAFGVVAGALGLFLVVFTLLAVQVRATNRNHLAAAAPPAAIRRVLERRVVIRTVIVQLLPAEAGDDGGAARAVRVSVPVVTGAPASVPAPAPAAPLVTRTS
jgi:hypothetical protein